MSQFLIVTDASPLMTLAAADALDTLLVNERITIPDAVYSEAADIRFPDGRRIETWVSDHADRIDRPKTIAGRQRELLLDSGRPARDFGEAAAFEVATRHLEQNPDAAVVLIYEDPHVTKLASAIDDPRIELTSTANYLLALEQAGHIPSALSVLTKARIAGRNVDRQIDAIFS